MDVLVVGLNHRTAPLEVRERLDFTKMPKEMYLTKLSEQKSVKSGLVLSTCNRVEVYVAGEGEADLRRDCENFLAQFHPAELRVIQSLLYSKVNRDAVRHLFRVASSLDSMVVGEPQILGQVKEAYFDSAGASLVDPFFDRLLRKAFSVAKRIRTETKIAEQAVSISYAAVEMAEKIFGKLDDKRVLILGAGEMAELTAKSLVGRTVKQVVFVNRSYEHSVELARMYGGIPAPLEQRPKYLAEADIVIVSTAAPHFLITRQNVEEAMRHRKSAPMFFIDISVPRNVEPPVGELEDVYLYNIDDLQGIIQSNMQVREKEAERADAMIEVEVDRFFQVAEKLELGPVIQSLQAKYGRIQEAEWRSLERKLGHLPDAARAEIEQAMKRTLNKILNDPILYLKGESGRGHALERAELLCRVFRLEQAGDDSSDDEQD